MARRLAAEGAAVVVAAKSVDPHPTLPGTIVDCVEAIREAGGTASWFQLDVRDADNVEAMIQHAKDEHGRIDYLFNNAGVGVGGEVSYGIGAHAEVDGEISADRIGVSVDVGATLAQLGLDSLVAVELRRWVRGSFGLTISVLEMMGTGSLRKFGELVAEKLIDKMSE